ncbi:MAG: hypothetical protein D8M57_09745 [Candidatus Scalindua sp. AMX11]|nr:MAG: hypothetical protein DWQ00_08495 [Candidatus Scalindua sp.]NOG84911.1 hypothetical protein [Planctomycetota bacterium]RZV84976.1 MAG: hypothetical protein EX341_08195 [Candidatus Scalindua sp. SCAELEC01]TDE65030.1 MAG: hypothetical protein D8M57_09745 [Candidatus Scalindua sp. AMX11]GJQ59423.1 MAG: hypothetical protein SCALA701_22240 [Candidatus Scalindua sp.]
MKKMSQVCMVLMCTIVLTTGVMIYDLKSNRVLGEELHHIEKATPTRSLMRLISKHTSKIMEAIMVGDFAAVIRESNAVAENSEIIKQMFFSDDGHPGDWYTPEGHNSEKAEKEMKSEFEKYLKIVIDTSRNIAETAKGEDVVETYKSFDLMVHKACFGCHGVTRDKWPEWPDFMREFAD